MTLIEAAILGIVQGLTEFIPISSSAHLIIVPWLFQWTDPALTSLSFDVALHMGTLAAVLWFFADDWVRIVRAGIVSVLERKIGDDPDRKLAWFLLIGSIPGGIAGVLLESKINDWFHTPNTPIQPSAMIVMAFIMALFGAALLLAEKRARHSRKLDQLTLGDSILIGSAQALAVFPGVSRSGSTIAAGLALGLERETAARFSFLLSAPIIAGAGLKSLTELTSASVRGSLAQSDLVLFAVGMVAAAISGYLTIRFLLRYLQTHPVDIFVYYRWGLALLIVLVALSRG